MVFLYTTNFNLTAPVNDFESAKKYLEEEKTLASIFNRFDAKRLGEDFIGVVVEISFILIEPNKGNIRVKTIRELTAKEMYTISEFLVGQAADGLGEGFSEQDFAINALEDTPCIFDWVKNNYTLDFIGKQ